MKKIAPYILELAGITGASYAGWSIYPPLGMFIASAGCYYVAQGLR